MARFRFADPLGTGVDMSDLALSYDAVSLSTADTLRFRDGGATIAYSGDFSRSHGDVAGVIHDVEAKLAGEILFTATELTVDAAALWAAREAGDEAAALRLLTAGKDDIAGTRLADRLSGASGQDAIEGGRGKDRIGGGDGADRLSGEASADRIKGGAGKDKLYGGNGDDRLFGGDGRDRLRGDAGQDALTGGDGGDRFIFADRFDFAPREAPDEIRDFSRREDDRIDLSALDANMLKADEQAFRFIGANGFSDRAGELRFKNGMLSGDIQGDGKADFHIAVDDVGHLEASDFLL